MYSACSERIFAAVQSTYAVLLLSLVLELTVKCMDVLNDCLNLLLH